ncbi:amino acid adenylation domain-containing protein [Streptomyces sp. NPDC056045]|uniref:non-ribosomal peptide synthetase n=1 Tax=Streptomyces sp. NPDC056045 TaxID=3345691 RepID=UPI0035E3AD5A
MNDRIRTEPSAPAGAGPEDRSRADGLASRQAALLVSAPEDFTVGMYGAWSAGLGVLPLPVEFPDERLRHMLADCRPVCLLSSAELEERARALVSGLPHEITVLGIEQAASAAPEPPAPEPDGPTAAFTVYTSGSTGAPKGVVIRRDQIEPLIEWSGRTWRLGAWARIAQTLSLGFDFGLQELFTVLPFGGCVVVPRREDRAHALSYARFLRRERVSVLFTTPSFADELIAAGQPLPDLRLVLLGGEVLRASTVAGLRALVPAECRLFNGYGPTEATVNCLMYEVPADLPDALLPPVLPTGSASASARIEIADEHGRPLPVGAVGELLIGGPGVADGYLGRPELTARRFVAAPDGSGTVYRSGDRAYASHDGHVVVLGRADRQVKIRGFRVELGEVEHVLRSAPGIASAVVRVVGRPGRLVAFVTGAGVRHRAVLEHAAHHLPPALVPEQLVVLERLPMTTNGKLDDAALERSADDAYATPVSADATLADVEDTVCRLWASVLAVPRVPPEANVFDLGAHSLVVTRMHGRLEAAFGSPLPVHHLFEYPCPRDLAQALVARRREEASRPRGGVLSAATVKDVQ